MIQSLVVMRIATWNLERPDPADVATNQARMEKIREVGADLWILTETHEVIDLSDTHHGAATAPSASQAPARAILRDGLEPVTPILPAT